MDLFTAEELSKHLETGTLGRNAVLLDTVDSTNTEARRMLADGCADGTVIIADVQTGGRGRRGRQWVSAGGCGLWMTAVIKPFMAIEEMQKLTLLAGLAVCGAVEQLTGGAVKPVIKWPNDVLTGGRKLCGILCESAANGAGQRQAIVGIGVNTRMPQGGWGGAAAVAVSLQQAAGRGIGRMELAAAILNRMERLLDGWRLQGFANVAEGYRQYMMPAGSAVEIIDGDRRRPGCIEGLDDDGALMVRLDTGELERVISGEISLRGVDGHA